MSKKYSSLNPQINKCSKFAFAGAQPRFHNETNCASSSPPSSVWFTFRLRRMKELPGWVFEIFSRTRANLVETSGQLCACSETCIGRRSQLPKRFKITFTNMMGDDQGGNMEINSNGSALQGVRYVMYVMQFQNFGSAPRCRSDIKVIFKMIVFSSGF